VPDVVSVSIRSQAIHYRQASIRIFEHSAGGYAAAGQGRSKRAFMEDWVHRALARWPNVPALFGWLQLDRRGRWLVQRELISRPQIIDTIGANYAADEHGRWYFQNGPQRGYVQLETAPLVLRVAGDGATLVTHNGLVVEQPSAAYLDEEGSLLLATEHGPAALESLDLDWLPQRLTGTLDASLEAALEAALALPSGSLTPLRLRWLDRELAIERLDIGEAPGKLGYVRDPQPDPG
jgi:hypothetical protein